MDERTMSRREIQLKKFSETYEETLRVLLEDRLLSDLPLAEAKEIRKLAREEAFRVAPELEAALGTYQYWLQQRRYHNGRHDMTSKERLGAKVLNRMGQVCLQNFHPPGIRKNKRKAAVVELPPIAKVVPLTLTQKYLAWIKEHDTVPADDALSFFLGCVNTNWSNARREAKKKGYGFDRVDGGMWSVTMRPLPEVEDLGEDEKDRLLRKVLSMPDLSDGEVVKILRRVINA